MNARERILRGVQGLATRRAEELAVRPPLEPKPQPEDVLGRVSRAAELVARIRAQEARDEAAQAEIRAALEDGGAAVLLIHEDGRYEVQLAPYATPGRVYVVRLDALGRPRGHYGPQ